MGKVYKNQTRLKIELTVDGDVSGATCLIKYIKPDKTEDNFIATIDNPVLGIISYTITSADDIDQAGTWIFWAYITYTDSKVIMGEAVKVIIYNEGE